MGQVSASTTCFTDVWEVCWPRPFWVSDRVGTGLPGTRLPRTILSEFGRQGGVALKITGILTRPMNTQHPPNVNETQLSPNINSSPFTNDLFSMMDLILSFYIIPRLTFFTHTSSSPFYTYTHINTSDHGGHTKVGVQLDI